MVVATPLVKEEGAADVGGERTPTRAAERARRATIQISRFSTFVENRHLPRASPFGAQFGRLGRPEAAGDPAHINLMVFSGACSRPFSDSKNRNFVLFPELAPLLCYNVLHLEAEFGSV